MTYSNLRKITLTTMALAASCALSAQAGSPTVSTATQAHGAASSIPANLHRLLFPPSTYVFDDGTAENGVGNDGGDIIELNEFAVIPGSETITSISIAFGSPLFPDPSLNGLSYTAVLWSDPNGDGSPTDAVVLATAPGTVSQAGTDTFIVSDITPTTVTTPNFFVGCIITSSAGQFPAALDDIGPIFTNRSFLATDSQQGDIYNLNNNEEPVAPLESFGIHGNWLIRADADGGGARRRHSGKRGRHRWRSSN